MMAIDSRTAATHMWMGKPLSSYETAELRLILASLEEVRYGSAVTYDNLARWELLEAVCDLDLKLERDRRDGRPRNGERPAALASAAPAVLSLQAA